MWCRERHANKEWISIVTETWLFLVLKIPPGLPRITFKEEKLSFVLKSQPPCTFSHSPRTDLQFHSLDDVFRHSSLIYQLLPFPSSFDLSSLLVSGDIPGDAETCIAQHQIRGTIPGQDEGKIWAQKHWGIFFHREGNILVKTWRMDKNLKKMIINFYIILNSIT